MKNVIKNILLQELNETTHSIQEIIDLGVVNRVFDVEGSSGKYIFRLNKNPNSQLEYQKEKWCLEKAILLEIPSPRVIRIGIYNQVSFMIQEKIFGINGKLCNAIAKESIWKSLGFYASKYQNIPEIEVEEVTKNEFHKDWKARLTYNIKELNKQDSLLKMHVFNPKEQQKAKDLLLKLNDRNFKTGLVHGDLCPRNVIWKEGSVTLVDWGTADIIVGPHDERGRVLMSNAASE